MVVLVRLRTWLHIALTPGGPDPPTPSTKEVYEAFFTLDNLYIKIL
jgi:hypothetical protein